MGKTWDSFVPGPSIWREVYRVLKPGGHALVFAGTRTQDLMTISLRLAGFEIRDCVAYLYFSGFPKSMDVGKAFDKRAGAEREVVGYRNYTNQDIRGNAYNDTERTKGRKRLPATITAPATPLAKKWDGWGTALKPAHEPIIMARKPLVGTVAENVEQFGTGALNIEGCRIPTDDNLNGGGYSKNFKGSLFLAYGGKLDYKQPTGRFPANIVTTESDAFWSKYCDVTAQTGNVTPPELSKKASKKDRNSDWRGEEIDLPERVKVGERDGRNAFPKNSAGEKGKHSPRMRNTHPTVKPTDLMAWLCRLVTPPGGIVLDPFAGSGSTLVAAKREGFQYIGIEREAEYVEIAKARVNERGDFA